MIFSLAALPLILFSLTACASAFLLFSVQPMLAKILLPYFGGSPAVWNTSMAFFQALLLGGYAYAHWLSRRRTGTQAFIHGLLLAAAWLCLPIHIQESALSNHPAADLLLLLFKTAALPFFILSATAPLIQKWFSELHTSAAKQPYFLYSASNLGSMTALLSYPFLIEPGLDLTLQSRSWAYIYLGFVLLLSLSFMMRVRKQTVSSHTPVPRPISAVPTALKVRWIFLSMIPSSLMLGITSYISQELASAPLIWMIPLALYLLTFILVFSGASISSGILYSAIFPVLILCAGAAAIYQPIRPLIPLAGLHLLYFFTASLNCHGLLFRDKPAPEQLTAFYFWISLGGMLGGCFNAFIAPALFNGVYEYAAAIVLSALFISPPGKSRWSRLKIGILPVILGSFFSQGWNLGFAGTLLSLAAILIFLFARRSPLIFFFCTALWLSVCHIHKIHNDNLSTQSKVIFQARSFFGVSRVREEKDFHVYQHGVTVHGMQHRAGDKKSEPLAYYHRLGPLGDIFSALRKIHEESPAVSVIGLGTGSASAYAEPHDKWTFFEIDPLVLKISSNPQFFSYLDQIKTSKPQIILGDGRTQLKQSEELYDLILIDAFSSDSVPTHFLTLEAFQLYLSKLSDKGAVAFHISSRHFDLASVICGGAERLGLGCLIRSDRNTENQRAYGKLPSTWAVITRDHDWITNLLSKEGWGTLSSDAKARMWTDSYSDLLSVLKK